MNDIRVFTSVFLLALRSGIRICFVYAWYMITKVMSYWQNNQTQSQQGRRQSGDGSSPYSGDSGAPPFRSPRPRYQSSPMYHPQYSSPFPDPYRQGGHRPQRSPLNSWSPSHDFNYPSPVHMSGNPDSPYHGNNRQGRGRGNKSWYNSPGSRDFTSPGSVKSECNPGASDDIRLYYSPDMVQDPWSGLKPVPNKGSTSWD